MVKYKETKHLSLFCSSLISPHFFDVMHCLLIEKKKKKETMQRQSCPYLIISLGRRRSMCELEGSDMLQHLWKQNTDKERMWLNCNFWDWSWHTPSPAPLCLCWNRSWWSDWTLNTPRTDPKMNCSERIFLSARTWEGISPSWCQVHTGLSEN